MHKKPVFLAVVMCDLGRSDRGLVTFAWYVSRVTPGRACCAFGVWLWV